MRKRSRPLPGIHTGVWVRCPACVDGQVWQLQEGAAERFTGRTDDQVSCDNPHCVHSQPTKFLSWKALAGPKTVKRGRLKSVAALQVFGP